ncbi:alpha/beta fold hydrolase [Marinomonas ostreistagni]|uniref:Alpha/beta fold hydrolase n=1 Tax=Marinomonas ostreistagni TaxID=359209 RepID=A0ABS0ZB83_9GAMM|nr:alpha/beta fold hydrolase [Marinomonas ostreistagni]MBJ7550668.1 alpha/beta fold hydrolase [Marinomonas ostreistagni]
MIHTKQYGENLPPLVVIHGLFGNADNWHSIAQKWAENFTVYCLDLPNHGRSSELAPTTYPALANAINEWLEEKHLSSIYLLGHSMGGKVAMQLTSDHPEKIKKLIVADIAPVDYLPSHTEIFKGLKVINQKQPASRKEADQLLSDYEPNMGVRQFLLKNLQRNENGTNSLALGLDNLIADYDAILSAPILKDNLSVETLFIKGENSPYILPEHQQQTLKHFPNASVKVIPETGHWLHAEKPTTFTSLVRRFLTA